MWQAPEPTIGMRSRRAGGARRGPRRRLRLQRGCNLLQREGVEVVAGGVDQRSGPFGQTRNPAAAQPARCQGPQCDGSGYWGQGGLLISVSHRSPGPVGLLDQAHLVEHDSRPGRIFRLKAARGQDRGRDTPIPRPRRRFIGSFHRSGPAHHRPPSGSDILRRAAARRFTLDGHDDPQRSPGRQRNQRRRPDPAPAAGGLAVPGSGPARTASQTSPSATATAPPGIRSSSAAIRSPTTSREPRTAALSTNPSTETARLTAVGVSLTNSTTTARPDGSLTAAARCTTSPPRTLMAVATTGMPSTIRERTAASSEAMCQRSPVPTAHRRPHWAPSGSTVPAGLTTAAGPSISPISSPSRLRGGAAAVRASDRSLPARGQITFGFRW